MLSRLKLSNFKCWEDVSIDFGRVTALFGRNSSGKSSLTQLLLLLKQTRDSADRSVALDLNGPIIQLGSMADIAHGHDTTKVIKVEVEFVRSADLVLEPFISNGSRQPLAKSPRLTLKAELEVHDEAPRSRSLTYGLGDTEFSLRPRAGNASRFELSATIPGVDFVFSRSKGRPPNLPRPIKTYRFPDEIRGYYQPSGFLSDLESALEEGLDGLYYLGPLRERPQRDYTWMRSRPSGVGEKGERTIDAIISAQSEREVQNLKKRGRRRPFAEIIAYRLRQLKLIRDFRIVEIAEGSNRWQAKVQTEPGGTEVLLTDVGFGVSQVLPVITLLHLVPKGSTVILEQPEIHLHPASQAELADVIIEVSEHRNVQVIIESHSEHLLLRLQRRVAEETLSANDTRLYFCDQRRGKPQLESLDLNMYGQILNWPSEFMGDAFAETAAAELARIKRKMEATS